MATWELKNSVLTNKGTEVLAKVQAGIGSLRVTRAVVGSGKVEEGELVNQTSVTNEKGEMQIVGKTGTVNGSIIDLRFDNTGLEESFDLWQIGIFVEHPDFEGEILYHISQATAPDEVPLPSVTPALLSYSLYINHTNVPDITIEINPVGTVPMELFQQHINDTLLHTNFVDAEGDGSALTVTYDKITTLEDGQHLSVRVPAALNEGATLAVNGGEAHNIVTTDGNNIKSNVVSSGFIIPVVYNAKTSKWNLEGVSTPADLSSIDSSIAEISNKIGKTSDGEEQLTLFGKLAAIIAKLLGIETKVDMANTNIDTINTKVGTSDDAKTKPTLFGKIAGIGDTLSENLTPVTEKITEVLNKVTESDTKIGTEGDADTQPTLFGRLAQLKNVLLEKLGEVITNITDIDNKIGTSSDTSEDETLFGKLENVSKSTRDMILVPSDNLKINLLDNEELQTEATSNNRVFIGYVRFNKSGFVKSVVNIKSLYNGKSMGVFLKFFDGVYGDRTSRSSIATLPVKGDKAKGSGSFGELEMNISLGSTTSNQYTAVTMHPYVVKDQLYAIVLFSGDYGGAVNSVKFYYDEVDGGNGYDSMP